MKQPGSPPLVSVIVPAYNAEAFLLEAVQSILGQTWTDLEVIVVDDGSTDATATILASIADPRVRVIHQANQGLAGARNTGMCAATGTYLAFLDADDRWLPGKLASDVEIFSGSPEVGIVVTNLVRFDDESGRILGDQFSLSPELHEFPNTRLSSTSFKLRGTAFNAMIKLGQFTAFHPAIAYRRAVIGDRQFLPVLRDEAGTIIAVEDLDFFLATATGTQVAYQTTPLVEVRRHSSNSTADYGSLTYAVLGSLRRLEATAVLSGQHRALLKTRIARQWANVGHWHRRSGRARSAAAAFLRTGLMGRPLAAAKGLLMLLISRRR